MASLQGRVALITGASSGVGRATALALAQAGAVVYAAARRRAELDDLAAAAPSIRPAPLDVSDRAGVNALVAAIEREQGRLDIVVAAAGTNTKRRRFAELSADDWQRLMETNATGAFHVSQAAMPALRAAAGIIIFIASISSRWPDASGPAYQASKRAMLGLAHAIAWEERGSGVRVSSVLPGLIDTPLIDLRPIPPPRAELDKALTAEDVADVCLFLCSLPPRVCVPELVMVPSAL